MENNTVEASPAEAVTCAHRSSNAVRWLELSLVLVIAFGNSIVFSTGILGSQSPQSQFQGVRWIAAFIHEASALSLVGYVLYRRRLRFADLGLRSSWLDFWPAILVTVASYLAYAVGYEVIHRVHQAIFGLASSGMSAKEVFGHPSIASILLVLLNPFFEELIVRAYLMTEVGELTGSWLLAAVVSVLFQTSYHLYYGWELALSLGCQFAVFAAYYAITRKITPVILSHAIFDVIGIAGLV